MFTVLIAEKEHIDAIQKDNRLFFEPFLANKELAFCEWNPKGQHLSEAVPGLYDVVGRKKDWRVVIINSVDETLLAKRNPFDVVDFSNLSKLQEPSYQVSPDSKPEEWEKSWIDYYESLKKEKEIVYRDAMTFPLQKLSTWLCFKPEDYILNDVNEKQDAYDWAMERLGDDLKSSAKLEIVERDYYKTEVRLKEIIRREFMENEHLSVSYPKEIYCISPRITDRDFFNPERYWNIRSDSEYSPFADRNMYFDKMRFMVIDLLPETHRSYRNDRIRFLASILIFISNDIPGSAMQSRRLYQLEIENDDAPLCTLVTSYDKKLASTLKVIENEVEKIKSEIPEELSDKAVEALFCTPKDVPVQLNEDFDPDTLFVNQNYGLFSDLPNDETNKWKGDYRNSSKALVQMVKQQTKSVKKSVDRLQYSCNVSESDISRLTSFQMEDVREFTENCENEMVNSIPSSLTDLSQYNQKIEEESEKVKKVLKQRMSLKTTLVLSAICLISYFACFIPFIIGNSETTEIIFTALTLTVGMIGLLALILFITLFYFRNILINSIKSYNRVIREIMNDVRAALNKVSKYLSASCNVRRGYSVQNYSLKHLDRFTMSLRIRKKHQEDIKKKRAYLAEEYKDFFGDKSHYDETMIIPYEYDFGKKEEYSYPAPFLMEDYRQIEFISGGNMITVPSSYITSILVRLEGIYDN